MSTNPEEEEEQKVGRPRGRPNAYWADHLKSTYEEGPFRGVRGVPHGGSKTVSPDDTAGSLEFCWCGLQYDHDWPGKAAGRSHPRKVTPMSQQAITSDPLTRNDLRGFHADLQELILTAVNQYGVKHRSTNNGILLFPPDGSEPFTISARNNERFARTMVKNARTWFIRHCVPPEELAKLSKPPKGSMITADTIKQLAEAVNSEEHLPVQPKPTPPAKRAERPPVPPQKPVQPAPESPDSTEQPEWVPHIVSRGKKNQHPHEHILTNGKGTLKCGLCEKGEEFTTDKGMSSMLGHVRTHHTDTSTLWGKVAKEKAVDTYYRNKSAGRIAAVIEELQDIAGLAPQKVDTKPLEDENKILKRDNAALAEQVTALRIQVADLEAKMALAREAFGL